MKSRNIRNFGKIGDAIEVPDLIEVQLASYSRFLQADAAPEKRKDIGLEALFREIFPIVSYDKTMELEYLGYELEKTAIYAGAVPGTSSDLRESVESSLPAAAQGRG